MLLAHLVHLVVEETGARKEEEKPGWHQGQVVLLEIRARNQEKETNDVVAETRLSRAAGD